MCRQTNVADVDMGRIPEEVMQARQAKKRGAKRVLINNNRYFIFRFINQGYNLFYIVKNFTQKLLWNSSCIAFMFLMPIMFEVLCEQEAVLDKI